MVEKNDVKLLGAWPSPFAMRVRIALKIKSINYELVEEKLESNFKSELLLKSNPVYKKIPVFFHSDKPPLCESLIIVRYIDDLWTSGPKILPSEPCDRAIASFWAAYVDEKLFTSMRGVLAARGDEARNAAIKEVPESLALLENAYKNCNNGEKFFGGDEIGYLDIALGSLLGWLNVIQKMNNVKLIDEMKTPGLFTWAEAFCADHVVMEFMPGVDKLIEFAKVLMAKYSEA